MISSPLSPMLVRLAGKLCTVPSARLTLVEPRGSGACRAPSETALDSRHCAKWPSSARCHVGALRLDVHAAPPLDVLQQLPRELLLSKNRAVSSADGEPASGSASAPTSSSMIVVSFLKTAPANGVCPRLLCRLTSAPRAISAATVDSCP